ncbi:MAG: hypothetical protein WBF21_08910 [Steroidobacteraceae bacterium]
MADEIDDAVGALRQCSLGLAAEFGLSLALGFGIAGRYLPANNRRADPPPL